MSDPSARQKLLIVERKLVHNRGHHHTQIAALRRYFPHHERIIVAGEAYDGFLGAAAGKLTNRSIKLAKLRSRLLYGNAFEQMAALFGVLKAKHSLKLPCSAFGNQLAEICRSLGVGADDLIVIPTADLDTLESAVELCSVLANETPRICLRFLNSELGDRNEKIRSRRLSAILAKLPAKVSLFSETEELAAYFQASFGMPVDGGFYLPCSMPVAVPPPYKTDDSGSFRVGIFGEPRLEKGSARIADIVAAVAELAEGGSAGAIDFAIQGSMADFSEGGVYGRLQNFNSGGRNITVSPQGNRISPQEFEQLFRSTDAILLPYEAATYGLQGSGVVQDAVAACKPIIYAQGMSMKAFLSFGNALPATTNQDFAEAILRIAANPSRFQPGTERAAAYFQHVLADSPLFRVLES
ncbi:hypothetical protein NOJ05_30405 [Neorhizobium galegae]|uniref:hypothetical protein n=1 Tax=Neorhizobium galegae TaxID=399 RepID=UPI0021068553|nr:hypothetical protein [Neorhizobium galegae]MCQ1781507.1 hypothetical protein [Neorhizobium galegae]MCQ1798483.1 hypothetical protein [Neorhizobium galegae]